MKSNGVFREEELDGRSILSTLQLDPIGRNKQLDTFLGLLNSIERNAVLTVDGDWGSGKTVFVKQVSYLSSADLEKTPIPSIVSAEEFQKKYTAYYYNAWENDFHDDPLQSLLFNLINDMWSKHEKMGDTFVKFSKGLLQSAMKTTSVGLIDPEQISRAQNIADLAKDITTASDRKKAVNDIIDNHLELKGKKLLFIIDELDRCKPTYAVKLLEVIKHYYTNDKVVFLMATNNIQLAHTVKKVYGESFNGAGYLSKFYDLVFNLPDFNAESYIKYLGANIESSYWKDIIPLEIAVHLELSLREINRYYSSLKLIDQYLSSESTYRNDQPHQLVKYLFIPLAYALRIHNSEKYHDFVRGRGADTLAKFCEQTNKAIRIVTKGLMVNVEGKQNALETIVEIYQKITTNKRSDGDSYDIHESADDFKRVVLLMNSSGTIDDKKEDATEV